MRSLKVLAIGNSFSEDSLEYLWPMAKDIGLDEIVIGHLMIGGSSLFDHSENLTHHHHAYGYFKNSNGSWDIQPDQTLEYGITDEPWDVITVQQVSALSGIKETYQPDLDSLISYIDKTKTNPKASIMFHMTWAYQHDSNHGGFAFYDNNQMTMYQGILDAIKAVVLIHPRIKTIIPTGTAIQNARVVLGDVLTRDGFHLDFTIGRTIAAMTWLKRLVDTDLQMVKTLPVGIDETQRQLIIAFVTMACESPFEIRHV